MVHDKNSPDPLIGLDLIRSEAIGLNKYDILGVATLSKLQEIDRLQSER